MKNLFSIIAGGIVGFAVAYYVISKPAGTGQPAAVTAAASTTPALPTISPVESLQKLTQLNPTATKDPARVIRQIVHHMESLVDAGNLAVAPIGEVIATGKDLDYLLDEPRTTASGLPFWNWHAGQPVFSGLVLPPSFRLGLVDVLKSIGTEQAENVMLVMLTSTLRAVEVAYIAQVLEKLEPGKYTEVGLAAAQRLLNDTSRPASTSPLDAKGDAYLYALLGAHGDKSLVATAQSKLVNNGRLDMDAAKYLITTLKTEALPELAKAYQGANVEDKNKIANLTFSYVGASAEADQIFKDWIVNSTQDPNSQTLIARPRAAYIQMLAGGSFGLFQAPAPTDPAVIASRIRLLTGMYSGMPESPLKQVVVQTLQKLNSLSAAR